MADGIKAMWLDDSLVVSYTNVPYTKENIPTAENYGFNRVVIGGNSSNYYSGSSEQWYAIDDVVVSTTPIPDNYVIGGPLAGDLNSDGVINIQDVQACVNHILGVQLNDNADVNQDGKVDVVDVQSIVNTILGG